MSDINKETYSADHVVEKYDKLEGLVPAEQFVFSSNASHVAGKVLDIGIGGGRTTAYLAVKAQVYVGVDYSERFVTVTSQKFPNERIECCDARDLSRFESDYFDLVNFSFNGLDYVNHADRQIALREIYRVLAPGGIFFFSTHNRNHRHFAKQPWQIRKRSFTHLKECIKVGLSLPRHWRMKKHDTINADYAIINDFAHKFQLMTYYVTVDEQRKQLERVGYIDVRALSREGEDIIIESDHEWLFVIAKKPIS